MNLKKLTGWMELLSGQDKVYREEDLVIHVYGEGDRSYVVIERERSKSPKIIDQYTIHPLENRDPLFSLVCFLNECGFDVHNVVSKISTANYVAEEINNVAHFKHVEIAHYQLEDNQL